MLRSLKIWLAFSSLAPLAGCPTSITVELLNDSSLPVEPNVVYDADESDLNALIAGLIGGGEDLATGLLNSGELQRFSFACDELGVIFSDNAEQRLLGVGVSEAPDSAVLQRGDEFDCGDVIEFRFVGSGDNFDVETRVNGQTIN